MALPLNVFKTVTRVATTSPVGIYTAPVGYTGVILLAQVANVDSNTHTISFSHRRTTAGIAVTTEIVKQFPVQGNDSVFLSASNSSNIKFIGSILETLN